MLVEEIAWDGLGGVEEDLALEEQRLWFGADQGESREVHRGEAWKVLDLGRWEPQEGCGQGRHGEL